MWSPIVPSAEQNSLTTSTAKAMSKIVTIHFSGYFKSILSVFLMNFIKKKKKLLPSAQFNSSNWKHLQCMCPFPLQLLAHQHDIIFQVLWWFLKFPSMSLNYKLANQFAQILLHIPLLLLSSLSFIKKGTGRYIKNSS